MRVLLVRPPRRDARQPGLSVPPLGLAYIAGALRDAHEVRILDAYALRCSWPQLEAAIARQKPDVIGITAMTPTADTAARAVSLARPHARWVILGGPHPTALGPALFDELPLLDAAVSGEGETVVKPLLSWLERSSAHRHRPPPPGALAPGHPLVPAPREPDLRRLPEPARDLLPRGVYRYMLATHPRFATAITSRGCPFSCSFCDKSVSGSTWRARPAEHVADELEALTRQGVRYVNLYDDNFTLRRDRVVAICEQLIARELPLRWKCEGRVDGVDPPLLRLMARAGCDCVAYGVESANPASLRYLHKRTTPDQARAAFAATHAAGIRSLAYLIVGVPGETAPDVLRTLRFARELGATYAQFSSLSDFSGTALPAGHNPLDGDRARPVLTDLPPAQLDRLLRQAWRGFYLRPRPMARFVRDAVRSGTIAESTRLLTHTASWLTRSAPATSA